MWIGSTNRLFRQSGGYQEVQTHNRFERAGLRQVLVHDLRHTFGHRLRAAGVSYEDRQDLLGHKSDRITTHYSAPDIAGLIEASEKVCVRRPNTVIRIAAHTNLTQFENSDKAVKEGRS